MTRKRAGLFITKGGRKIGKLLARLGIGTSEFARKAGVERVTLHRVINGERWKNITVDFAIRVCDASEGAARIEDFSSITASPAEEEEEPARRRATGTDG